MDELPTTCSVPLLAFPSLSGAIVMLFFFFFFLGGGGGGGGFFFFFFFFRSWGLQFHKMFFYSNRLLSIPTALI